VNMKVFGKLVNEYTKKLRKLLLSKGNEYSTEKDKLHNFHKAALLNNCLPATSLWGMVTKHVIALSDFVEREENGEIIPLAQWQEKIHDIGAYMVLLDAIIQDGPSS